MLTGQEHKGVLHIRAGGRLSEADYEDFIPLFERAAAKEAGTVPMVIELLPDFAGWDLGGLWRDMKFDVRHKDQFGRIAIVGDKKWEEWATKLFDPLFRAEMRFFPTDRLDEAEAWVLGETREG